MKGFIIAYKAKDANSRTILNHTLFGRIVYRNYRGRRYAYYVPGLLHDIKFARLLDSKIFVEENILNVKYDWSIFDLLGEMTHTEAERDESELSFNTGKEHWSKIVKEKGLVLREQRRKINR